MALPAHRCAAGIAGEFAKPDLIAVDRDMRLERHRKWDGTRQPSQIGGGQRDVGVSAQVEVGDPQGASRGRIEPLTIQRRIDLERAPARTTRGPGELCSTLAADDPIEAKGREQRTVVGGDPAIDAQVSLVHRADIAKTLCGKVDLDPANRTIELELSK